MFLWLLVTLTSSKKVIYSCQSKGKKWFHEIWFFFLLTSCSSVPSNSVVSDSMYCSPLSTSVHGIFQARMLDHVVIFSSKESPWTWEVWTLSPVSSALHADTLPLSYWGLLRQMKIISAKLHLLFSGWFALNWKIFTWQVGFRWSFLFAWNKLDWIQIKCNILCGDPMQYFFST